MSDLKKLDKIANPTRDKIITELYKRKDLKKVIKKIAKDPYLTEELTSELFLRLCKLPEDVLITRYNDDSLDWFILDFLNKQFNSKTSPFYNQIKKHVIGRAMTEEQKRKYIIAMETDTEMNHVHQEALKDAIENLRSPGEYPLYHRDIIKLYLELGNIRRVSERVGIRPEYISQALKDAKEMLKEAVSKEVNEYLDNKIQ